MKIPYWLYRLLPMWDYICPRCKKTVPKNSHKCPYCNERYGKPLNVPPSYLKSKEALEKYVHEKVFPRISTEQREYLAKYFTVLFQDGFESGNFSAWTGTSGTPTIVTSPVHHGNYAAKFTNAPNADCFVYKSGFNVGDFYCRFYFRSSAYQPSNWHANTFARVRSVTGDELANLQIITIDGTPTWRFVYRDGDNLIYTVTSTSDIPPVDTWHCGEIHVKIDGTNGIYDFWLDGVLKFHIEGCDSDNFGNVGRIDLGQAYYAETPVDIYIDCVVVADTYIGPEEGLVAIVTPTELTVIVGQNATFNCIVSGGEPPYSYQWLDKDGNPIPNQTSASMTVNFSQAGDYQFSCKVTDSTGATVVSNTATLHVRIEAVEVFDDCSSLAPTGKYAGNWEIQDINQGSTVTIENGKFHVVCGLGGEAKPTWTGYFVKWALGQPQKGWDLSKTPILRVRINPEIVTHPIDLSVYNPGTGGFFKNIIANAVAGKENIIEIDMRLPESGVPDLTKVTAIVFHINGEGAPAGPLTSPTNYYFGLMELLPGGPLALEADLNPKGTLSMVVGGSINFLVAVRGGTPPYTVTWYVNDSPVGAGTTFTFTTIQTGEYKIYASVTDAANNTVITPSATVTVKTLPPPPRPLHTEGNRIFNDLGELVHLHGVCFPNFTDSSAGWFPGGSYLDWDEEAVIRTLETLRSWGCNFISTYHYYDWLNRNAMDSLAGPNTTTIGNRDALKRFVELAYQYGIYVGIGIYAISPDIFGNPAGPQWVAAHKDEWVSFWLSLVRDFKLYPNVIFAFLGEPDADEDTMNAYFQACVDALKAVRAESDKIFAYHEGYCGTVVSPNHPLHQYASNVIYDTHIYRWHGTFGNNPDVFTGFTGGSNQDGVWRYDDVKDVLLNHVLLGMVLNEWKVPVVMWEGAPNTGVASPNTWGKELTCFINVLKIFNELGVGYAGWWWRNGLGWDLFVDPETFTPTEWGQVLINACATAPTAPPTVTYTLTIIARAGGTTNPSPGTYTIIEGQQQQVTAIPDANYRFVNWLLDGVSRTENPIIVTMDADHTLEAVFEYVPPPPLTATISGTVKDPAGNPIAGAVVTCDGYADVTEIDGSYIIAVIPAKPYTLKVTKEGYQTQTIQVDLSAGGTFTQDITLTPTPKPPPKVVRPLWTFPILTWIREFIRRILGI